MIKNTILLISIIVASFSTYSALNNEKIEHIHVLDAMKFIPAWSVQQDYANACSQENLSNISESDAKALEVYQINSLISKALLRCTVDHYVGVPLNIGKALFEAAAIPVRATIPYELAKKILSSKESTETIRCSDYIEPIVLACPKLLKPYTKQIKQLG